MSNQNKLISIVIPAYNEEDCVDELFERLVSLFESERDSYDFEVIVVENGSIDKTWQKLRDIHLADPRFKVIKLSRNFRMDGGITAGLDFVKGDACVLMTADLQDPPEIIGQFLREWENGWENVFGIVTKREGTGPIRRFNSQLFYWLASRMTDGRLPKNASDFRLVDRKVYQAIRSMQERNRFMRGLFAWSGFKSIGIPIERPPRFGGVSNAHSFKVIDLALKGIFSHSFKPLRFITFMGLILSFFSFSLLVPFSIIWFTRGVPFAGFGSIVGLFMLLNSMLFLMLGIVGEYIGLIFEESKKRPNYLVTESLGLEGSRQSNL